MKKSILLLAILFVTVSTYAQADTNVKTEKKGDVTGATYYYEDGTVQQEGTFNAKGKLHGTWTSYDVNGNKLAVGKYANNKKVGKWLFWTDGKLTEVDYIDSRIVSVNEWKDKTEVAVRNK
ncbi:MAG: nicotinic acid mononucleotide adenyltransferase [Bacteroidetes bacterium]|nr:MAG: nicotinic acid mononucleotide adenyltransferase [Bacteroidota bacterium]